MHQRELLRLERLADGSTSNRIARSSSYMPGKERHSNFRRLSMSSRESSISGEFKASYQCNQFENFMKVIREDVMYNDQE